MEQIKGTVESLLKGLRSRGPGMAEAIAAAFTEKERGHMKVLPARQGRVRIAVDSSTWLYYFNLHRERLLGDIRGRLPEVKEISFVIGDVGEKH